LAATGEFVFLLRAILGAGSRDEGRIVLRREDGISAVLTLAGSIICGSSWGCRGMILS
jgi:hypothetical protein